MNKKKFWISLIIYSLVGQVAWVIENMYFNVFIYKMFNASAEDISVMVMASAVAATVTTIIMGALSDKVGKRKIFMSLGYIIWGITILSFAFIRKDIIGKVFNSVSTTASVCITLVIIMDCVMTFFGSTANDAAYNAWLTDMTDETNRGKAEGINSMMPLVAILVVFGGFMGFNLDNAQDWTVIYLITGILVSLIGVLGLFIIEDPVDKIKTDDNVFKNIIYGFNPKVVKEHKNLYLVLIMFAVFGISIQIFMPYLIIYYEQTLLLSDYVLIMAPAILLAAVFTAIFGRLYDKNGYKKSIITSLVILSIGYIFLFVFPGLINVTGFAMKALVFIGSLLMMCGYLSGMATYGAKIKEEIPDGMAGRFQGLRIVGQVLIPGVIGPFIGKLVLSNAQTIINSDGTESFLPNEYIFLAALVVSVLLLIVNFLYKNNKEKSN